MKTAVGQFRSLTRAILIISLIALVSATRSAAQDSSTQDSTYSAPQQQSLTSPPELSADQIIAILQANPAVAQNLKMAAAQNGLTGTREQAIQRLQTDESARIQVTQYLIDQGVVDPNDPALHANDRNQSGQNSQYGTGPTQRPNYPPNQQQQPNGQQAPYGQQVPYPQQPYGQAPYGQQPYSGPVQPGGMQNPSPPYGNGAGVGPNGRYGGRNPSEAANSD